MTLRIVEGQRIGRLVVLGKGASSKSAHRQALCRCDCGAEKLLRVCHLLTGAVASCGCLQKELLGNRKRTHGNAGKGAWSLTYRSWQAMKRRCLDSKNNRFESHGGRGIVICKRWLKFENFLADMGERPSKTHSIDRYPNNDGNYEPGNCRWATAKEQANNRRKRSCWKKVKP